MRTSRLILLGLPIFLLATGCAMVAGKRDAAVSGLAQATSHDSNPVGIPDSTRVASLMGRKVLRGLAKKFVGEIEFDHTSILTDGREQTQHARLYLGANGELRFDLWVPPNPEGPMRCCVIDDRVWFTWADGRVAHESAYPMDPVPEGGITYHMWALAGQARAWSAVLTGSAFTVGETRVFRRATLDQKELDILLVPLPGSDSPGDLRVHASFFPEFDEFFPTGIQWNGVHTTLSDYVEAGDGKMLPRTIRTVVGGQETRWQLWTIQKILPRDPSDDDFHSVFNLEFLPDVLVKLEYDPDGTHTLVQLGG